ncbi:lipid IV(A) 3-deoxy-D-manno-octulosonic acid transferase [Thalassotalea aquiviva]|uniref:lipid IV(A) 3-deoxy-D-manno-octulosonic acid transferase n=1 Tax=Thalassotalea aquiviva TaxID=3242415 RepID=UPI00352B17F1
MNKEQFSLRIYQLIILLLTPVLVLVLLFRSTSQKAYRQRLKERFGILPRTFNSGSIVIHAASVGEVLAIKPFIEAVLQQHPDTPVTVTTFTPTGSEQVLKLFQTRVQHCYIPLDNPLSVHWFLQTLKPKALVLMETELWPSLIHRCYQRNVPMLLINGRLSAGSMRSYQKLRWLISPALNKIEQILCQSEDNANNFIALGACANKVRNSGNLKYDMAINKALESKRAELLSYIPKQSKIVVAGSTHQNEEKLIIDSFKRLKQHDKSLLLVLVPRHPERFDAVAKLAQQQDLSVVRRSQQANVTEHDDVWLIDTLGELLAVYALADVCVIGGSFYDVGGHNPLEPALFAKPVIVGPNMSNFVEINQKLKVAKALVQLGANEDLTQELTRLLHSPSICRAMGAQGLDVVAQNQGATQKSIEALAQLLN